MTSVVAKRTAGLARLLEVEAVRVTTIVRRPDAVLSATGSLSWLIVPEAVRKAPRLTDLPQDMAIVLDLDDGVHLIEMGGVILAPERELRYWPKGTVEVVIGPGRGWFRPLRITDDEATVTLAAPWLRTVQREAFQTIERATGRG